MVVQLGVEQPLRRGFLPIDHTGTINASNALSLTVTSGDIVNASGTLSGGSVALAALNGEVVNEDQLNTLMVDGGKAQSLNA